MASELARRRFLKLAVLLWIPLLVWWMALLPGGMSPDSIDTWGQIERGAWSNHHPAPYTAFMWLTSGGGRWIAGVSLAHTALAAASLASLAVALADRFRIHIWWPTAAAMALVTLPLAGPFVVTIWKDVPTTAGVIFAASLLMVGPGTDGRRPWWFVALAATCGGMALVRWNGVATAIATVAVAALAFDRRTALRVFGAGTLAAAAGFGLLTAIPSVTAVAPPSPLLLDAQQLADLGQFVRRSPAALRTVDIAAMEEVAPLDEWREAASDCYSVDPVVYGVIYNRGRSGLATKARPRLDQAWRHVVTTRPAGLVAARLCRSSLAWNPTQSPNRSILTVYPRVDANDLGLVQSGPQPLRRTAVRLALLSERRSVQIAAWRPSGWVLLAACLTAVAVGRRQLRAALTIFAAPLGVLASYAASPATQDARYTVGATFVAQIVVVAALGAIFSKRTRRRSGVVDVPASAP